MSTATKHQTRCMQGIIGQWIEEDGFFRPAAGGAHCTQDGQACNRAPSSRLGMRYCVSVFATLYFFLDELRSEGD